ncbi:MAG: N-acetyltransferase [Acidobacteriota bacterium]
MNVLQVGSRRDLKRFIDFPYHKYAGHPQWVPPLRLDEWAQFDPRKNPSLEHLRIDMFLACEGSEVRGRIGAILNFRHDQVHGDDTAFFGFFEAADEFVAKRLFDRVAGWARSHGRSWLRGPVNPTLNDPCGFQVDAFDQQPYILTVYSPPEYVEFARRCGFAKVKDLLAWKIDIANCNSSRLSRIAERIRVRNRIEVRPLDLKRFDSEAETILDIYRESWAENWGFVPPTTAEFRAVAKQMKMILKPSLVRFAEIDGRSVGFSVTLPDINQVLKRINGRLFPLGLLQILLTRRKINRLRMPLLGVRPEFRRRGIFAPLITDSIRNARKLGYTEGECSWTLEDNHDISAAIEASGSTQYKTYRIYQKRV